MKYLVTGGCGFIGSHIAEELVKQGYKVRILDNLSSGHEENIAHLGKNIEFIKADVRDTKALKKTVKGIEYIFHEAALVSVFDSIERPMDNNEINITGTLNVLMAARDEGVKRVLIASSAAVYGNDPQLPKTETMKPQPESPYAVAKIIDEYYLTVFSKVYGLETVNLRYFNVYGPRQDPGSMYSGVISKFVDVLNKGQIPVIFGDGRQTRDFVYVKDVARANILAMHSDKTGQGEVFNVATGQQVNLLHLLEILTRIFKVQAEPVLKDPRTGDIKHSVADISLIKQTLDFSPEYTLEQGLRELVSRTNTS